ncbi:MAG TPA: sugar phosphate isomerase/epimerase [Vicinamibacterales bacterium]|nr:sugar phosphate isomerase/epimerase [Vicinamibacterales bacterium]
MSELNRRDFLALAAVPLISQVRLKPDAAFQRGQAPVTPAGLQVCMHEASSERFDFRAAMEGYAKAGVRLVEPNLLKVQEFAQKQGGPAAAKRLLDDLGLRPASTSNQLFLMEPGEQRLKSIEELKWKVELIQAIGGDRLVTPSAGTGTYTEDDFKRGIDHMREAAEIARPFGVTLMLEFARTSRFAGSLPTALSLVRETKHPNYRVMMDTYHFWGGISKFEDLELLRDGELHHLHFEDVPATPYRELQGQPHRVFPGEGIAPLRRIIEVLKAKKYTGAVSFETFNPDVQATDPYQVAMRVRKAIEPLIT